MIYQIVIKTLTYDYILIQQIKDNEWYVNLLVAFFI